MPTQLRGEEAKRVQAKAESLARARQWRDENLSAKSPASTKSPRRKTNTPKKHTPQSKAKKTTKKAAAIKEAQQVPTAIQCCKTPSKEDQAKARAKAKEWSVQRKKKKVLEVWEIEEVPAVVKTNANNEVEDLSTSDDFKTARATEAQIVTIPKDGGATLKDLTYLKNDVENVYNRLQDVCDKYAENIDSMECD
mmetsp:Transcript_22275/g.39676  ORF Transcript_22275/g.39676 Transcript_22275/m.39676 type:complete len:194 (-) Transcript_22275:149-730(-)|eukprot:CAMPEP_0201675698 /NCGR_PEP_ID=MMETSP0494-20130426/40123_1 /ASSEMBLY_ACC=CAM_ASM_000839 /TAXON_ID=420259 /ORGANISM="Thalassiosira gravida, Strain GMp14c1" /LENGTH=193 /DNA_ID=CAMNT_0048158217 /DNA_START=235 /DNA_END=816 /DNA_ORIENTATION=-